MKRSLYYSFYPDQGLTRLNLSRFFVAMSLWNEIFTWSHESLTWTAGNSDWLPNYPYHSPESNLPFGWTDADDAHEFINKLLRCGIELEELEKMNIIMWENKPPLPHTVKPYGSTSVGQDEWNAYLVCAFARSLSIKFPGSIVKLSDDGWFIRPKHIFYRNGKAQLDEDAIRRTWELMKLQGLWEQLETLEEGVYQAKSGNFFADVLVKDYLDLDDFRNLIPIVGQDVIEKKTLVDIGEYIKFPGESILPGTPL